MKKIISSILCLAMGLSLIVPSFATNMDEIQGPVHEILHGESAITRAATPPTQFYNLAGDNNYTAELLDLAATKGSYTKYYFATSTGKLYLKADLLRSGTTVTPTRILNIELYSKQTEQSFPVLQDSRIISFRVPEETWRVTFSNLDPNLVYYLYFYNDSNGKPSDRLDISGSILVDDTYN